MLKIFKQTLKAILPFAIIEYEKDFTEPEDLEKFRELIKMIGTENIEIINEIPNARNDAYYLASIQMVDTCDEMVFVWDELKSRGKGGTAEIIGYYACKKNRVDFPIIKQALSKMDFTMI